LVILAAGLSQRSPDSADATGHSDFDRSARYVSAEPQDIDDEDCKQELEGAILDIAQAHIESMFP
jgi:hypothetical protein